MIKRANLYLVIFAWLLLPFGVMGQGPSSVSGQKSAKALADSLAYYQKVLEDEKATATYYENLISKERNQLIKDIHTMRNIFPLSAYNGQILMRLAELTFEQETDRFDSLLDERELRMEAADAMGEKIDIEYPTQTFAKTLKLYDEILQNQTYQEIHDQALYFKSLCLIQAKREDEALLSLQELTGRFPKSDYYVKSLIKMGDYYFNRPYYKNGQGYQLAADAYRKVIQKPNNPLFSEAMFKLGWCYFQQDRYQDAMAAFKTLIENSNLNFTEISSTRLIKNPLLRDEAIEFIAVSLDESGTLEEAHQFLKLISNENYTAKVLMKLNEIYTLQSDFEMAIKPLQLILEKYPLSEMAPQAKLTLARNYGALSKNQLADEQLSEFFDHFSKGSEWYRNNKNPKARAMVDSQAVKILLRSTENILIEAQEKKDRDLFIRVAKSYNRLLEEYPEQKEAYDVQWNLAIILDKKIDNPSAAYFHYMAVATGYPKQSTHRKKALLSAIATAQKRWNDGKAVAQTDTSLSELIKDTHFTDVEKDLLAATQKFYEYFPNEPEVAEILLLEATLYYNRSHFTQAIQLFKNLLAQKPRPKNFQEVTKLLALAHMALKNYKEAEAAYGQLAATALDPGYISLGEKGRVEAGYRGAELLESKGKYAEAAKEYIAVAKRNKQADLADISHFAGAEAWEKAKNYEKAAEAYLDLQVTFPSSKYADGAIFNAAANYEKTKKYTKAIEAYESLIRLFPKSPHVKNSLFNIALNYEKLENFEKVAETNQRFAELFPGEKDAPEMLFTTGTFYMKAKKFGKAITIFRRFYTMYIGQDRELESRNLVGKCYIELGIFDLAKENFSSTISRTQKLRSEGKDVSDYFAAEAELEIAGLLRLEFSKITLAQPEDFLKEQKKLKIDKLKEAVEAYKKVVAFNNENSLKATYYIGSLYESMAHSWKNQERPTNTPPAKLAAREKKILNTATKFIASSIPFYKKNIEFADKTDKNKISPEAMVLLDSARLKLVNLENLQNSWSLQSAYVILESPIPEKIKKNMLTRFLYRSKLLDATVKDFEKAVKSLQSYHTALVNSKADKATINSTLYTYEKENYLLGARYYNVAEEILAQKVDSTLDEDTKEELQFQLEDMAFENQDKAIPLLKASLKRVETQKLKGRWSREVIKALRKLDSQNFKVAKGSDLIEVKSDALWWASSQSFKGWESNPSDTATQKIFGPVNKASFSASLDIPGKNPDAIWDMNKSPKIFLRKIVDITKPIESAAVDITAEEDYILYINGKLIATDTKVPGDFKQIKSIDVTPHLVVGPNLIAIQAESNSPAKALLFSLEVTTGAGSQSGAPQVAQTENKSTEAQEPQVQFYFIKKDIDELKATYKNREIYKKDLINYQEEAQKLSRSLRSEQNKINFLRNQIEDIDKQSFVLQTQLEHYKNKTLEMKR